MIVNKHACGNCDDSDVRLNDTKSVGEEDGYEIELDEYECHNCGAQYSVTSRYPTDDDNDYDEDEPEYELRGRARSGPQIGSSTVLSPGTDYPFRGD